MKRSGLRNRFPERVRNVWLGWHACLVCGKNGWDVLHHIVSPSSRVYVDGEHNESVFNACPIHNYQCHVGNEAFLYNEQNIALLLSRVEGGLAWQGYTSGVGIDASVDEVFRKTYHALYAKANSRERSFGYDM